MKIKDFVLAQKQMGINDWFALIAENHLQEYEAQIIECADYFGRITVNKNATFVGAINL